MSKVTVHQHAVNAVQAVLKEEHAGYPRRKLAERIVTELEKEGLLNGIRQFIKEAENVPGTES